MAGCTPVCVPTGPDEQPEAERIRAALTPRTRAVITVSPQHGVAVIPCTAFGVNDQCCLRLSYGAPRPETAEEGVRRSVKGLCEL